MADIFEQRASLYTPQGEVSETTEDIFSQREKLYKKPPSFVEKVGRLGAQLGVGIAQSASLPADVAMMASKGFVKLPGVAETLYRQNVMEDIEQMALQKATGVWSDDDQILFENLQEQIRDPEKLREFVTTDVPSFDSASLIEKVAEKAGIDLKPEGVLEHAARWAGFIKNPSKVSEVFKISKEAAKNPIYWAKKAKDLLPTLDESTRGLAAASALELAAQNDFGPTGQIAATILGDLIGGGIAGGIKGAMKLASNPGSIYKNLGRAAAKGRQFFSTKASDELRKNIAKSFEEAGLTADLGTLTQSNLVKGMQARLAASSLTGKSLDSFRKELTSQIEREYENIANSLGEVKYSTLNEVGDALLEGLEKARETDLNVARKYYEGAREAAKGKAILRASSNLSRAVENLEKELQPGSIKSPEIKKVLDTLNDLKKDIRTPSGGLKEVPVSSLLNNKINLADLIDYEVQGGAKQLLKGVVKEIDKSLKEYGVTNNPKFYNDYVRANKRFAEHAKSFRNRGISSLLKSKSPEAALRKMGSLEGIKEVKRALGKTEEGLRLFDSLSRSKIEELLWKNMQDSVTGELRFGKFANSLTKGKNREIVKELISPSNFQKLEKLQRSAGFLAESAQKFLNSSKTASVAVDAAIVTKLFNDFLSALNGNPWPLMREGSVLTTARMTSRLISNPEFLKGVQEVLAAGKSNNPGKLIETFEKIGPLLIEAESLSREK